MKYTKIFRILGIATILSLLMLVIPAAPALAARNIEIDPDRGDIGDTITITGWGWVASTETLEKHVDIYFAAGDEADTYDDIGDEVDTYELMKSPATGYVGDDDEGEFETTFKVPTELRDGTDDEDVEYGTYYVYVTYYDSSRIRAVAEFTVIGGEIELDPDDGPVGTEVEISGKEFNDEEDIEVFYDGDEVDIESGDDETDDDGEFTCTILIPLSTAGDHAITVEDESGSEAEAEFTVEPEITVTPAEGPPSTEITVIGTGFSDRSETIVYFDERGVKKIDTDREGSFKVTFNVLATESGIYDVRAEDEDDNEDTTKFTATATASMPLLTGNVGTELTVEGSGFIVGGTVTVKYDDVQVATVTASPTGAFSATFKAPASKHGDHTVTVTDGTTAKQFTFTMESTSPPAPVPLLPEMGVEVEQPVHFDWEDVSDNSLPITYTLQIASDSGFTAASIVLAKESLTKSEYTLTEVEKLKPTEEETYYYWRVKAIDGASNESDWTGTGTFFVGSAAPPPPPAPGSGMPGWIIYALFGVGALLLGLIGFLLGRRTTYTY